MKKGPFRNRWSFQQCVQLNQSNADNLKQVAAQINGEFHASVDGIALEATFTEIAKGISQAR